MRQFSGLRVHALSITLSRVDAHVPGSEIVPLPEPADQTHDLNSGCSARAGASGLPRSACLRTRDGEWQAWPRFEASALHHEPARPAPNPLPLVLQLLPARGAEGVTKSNGAERVTNSCTATAAVGAMPLLTFWRPTPRRRRCWQRADAAGAAGVKRWRVASLRPAHALEKPSAHQGLAAIARARFC